MSAGAWDAMLHWEAETGQVITSVPGIPPREPVGPVPFSCQAGLSALRAGARLAGVTDRENGDAPDRWVESGGMGGYVCSVCGVPVESEPCDIHQPDAYARCVGTDREDGSRDDG